MHFFEAPKALKAKAGFPQMCTPSKLATWVCGAARRAASFGGRTTPRGAGTFFDPTAIFLGAEGAESYGGKWDTLKCVLSQSGHTGVWSRPKGGHLWAEMSVY